MTYHDDPFAPALNTAHTWLRTVADRLATEDRTFALRALRAWLHTVRDRLDVPVAAHFSAQLPELLRGIFYEGWVPAHVPVHHDVTTFVDAFAQEAGVSPDEAVALIGAVTIALSDVFSPGISTMYSPWCPSRCARCCSAASSTGRPRPCPARRRSTLRSRQRPRNGLSNQERDFRPC